MRVKTIDLKLEALGFHKFYESELVVSYEKTDDTYRFTQVVELLQKQNIDNQILSFDKADQHVCGLGVKEATLFMKRMNKKWGREKKRK